MEIYVSMATLNGTNLQIGDEIGVFDGDLCVGAAVLTEELTADSEYLLIEAPRQFLWWSGFIPGDTITYRFCTGGEVANPTVVPSYISNGPVFEVNESCIVELHAINTPPTFTTTPDTVAIEDLPYSYFIHAEDMDGDSLIYSTALLPTWLSFDSVSHLLSGIPANEHVGEHPVALIVNDGTADAVQSMLIRVENVNDPPVITSEPVTEARPGTAYSYTIIAEDMDGDTLMYTALVLPGWLEFHTSTHTLAATPGEGDVGDQHVTIRVSDGTIPIYHTFVISVSSANHAPTFTSEPETSVVVGDMYTYTISAEDIDGDTLSYTTPQLPEWLRFDDETNAISGMPDSSVLGRHDVVLRVSDGIVSADQVFPIFVENINAPPRFISTPPTSISAGDLYVYYALAEDPDGDELSYSALTLPAWLSFDVNTRGLHGTPSNEDTGDHNVSLQVTDGEGAENQHFVITVDFVYGIPELDAKEGILIYPNPSHGQFFIVLSKEVETEVSLEIMDPLGRILQQDEFPPYFLIHKEYNLDESSPGLYLIRIHDNTSQAIRKLILK
jgi:hypothetical protein